MQIKIKNKKLREIVAQTVAHIAVTKYNPSRRDRAIPSNSRRSV